MNTIFNNKKRLAITGALALTLCSGGALLSASAHNKSNTTLAENNSTARASVEATIDDTAIATTDTTTEAIEATTSDATTTAAESTTSDSIATTTETATSDSIATTTKAATTSTDENKTAIANDTTSVETTLVGSSETKASDDYLHNATISDRYLELIEQYKAEITDIPASSYMKNPDSVKAAYLADSKDPEVGDIVILFLKDDFFFFLEFQKYLSDNFVVKEFFDTEGGFDFGDDHYYEYFNSDPYDSIAEYYRDDNAIILLTSFENLGLK
ncbi:MAG: hypothetical protein MJ236_06840 [Clostridia bacterium]|nr:hypothetical protein [Clostridia bacterium]